MFAVPVALLPENRRKQMTAEEMRQKGRQQRDLRATHALLDKSGEGIPIDAEQIAALTEEVEALEKQNMEELKGERIIGFARLYSGL
ncbi:hypothetical protein G6F60_015462 [Rhizopus arrhizus]|nr:hypothetical protein G6F60_015462 [Rhizopus arrhizus]